MDPACVAPPPAPLPPEFEDFTKYDLSSFYYGSGETVSDLMNPYHQWFAKAFRGGYHLYQESLVSSPATSIAIKSNLDGVIKQLINLSSYNYLGMATSKVVTDAAVAALHKYGLGAAGGPILSGMFDVHRDLEQSLARFKHKEACVLFPTGYGANVGIISAIMRPGDHVFLDLYSHASIVDGAVLAKAKTTFFRHNNERDLERKLQSVSGAPGKRLVVVEGVYSMDGDLCRLPEIVAVAKRYNAQILIDEAHSAFVFGEHGRGVAEHFGLESEIDFHMGTLSKAVGAIGGYACGDRAFAQYLEAYARPRFYSCTLPPAVVAGALASLHHIQSHPELRARLFDNVHFLQRRFAELEVDIGGSQSQVIPVMIYEDAKAFRIAQQIRDRGVFLQPVTYPGVPKRRSRLRLSVTALHDQAELDTAARVIADVLRKEGVPCRS